MYYSYQAQFRVKPVLFLEEGDMRWKLRYLNGTWAFISFVRNNPPNLVALAQHVQARLTEDIFLTESHWNREVKMLFTKWDGLLDQKP